MANYGEEVNFKITQGDTFLLQLDYTDDQDQPINIEGYSVLMEVRDKPGSKFLAAKSELGDGIIISDAVNGIINIEMSPDKTRKFPFPRAAYQVQVTDNNDMNTTLVKGWFLVDAGVID